VVSDLAAKEARVADEAAGRQQGREKPRTLAEKVNWLIEHAHPAGRGPYSNAEIVALIEKATGEEFSHTTIWKLRNGQSTNPQMRLIEALVQTFGVPPGYFFEDFDERQAGLLAEQVELLAIIREAGITAVQLRALAGLSDEGRQVIVDLIKRTAYEVLRERDERE
jgi:transcriptional regulator with XRE-family HTH domain